MIINQKVRQSIAWNTLEAVCYQVMLLGHQLSLYKMLDTQQFGLVGMLFATTYFFAAIISGGFDAAITPFFSQALLSKQAFRIIITRSFVNHCLLMIAVCASIIAFSFFSYPIFVLAHIPAHLLGVVGLLALNEGIHKLLKTIAQLAFRAKHVAFIELATLFCYTGSVWGAYVSGISLSLELIFTPMLVTSLAATITYVLLLWNGYASLPEDSNFLFINYSGLYRSRIMNFFNQMGHTFFSSNFLVPWIATHVGLAQAGVFKLISHICYFITPLLQRIFGFSSQALFAHIRDVQLHDRIAIMTNIHNKLMFAVYGVVLFLAFNMKTIIGINEPITEKVPLASLILFMILLISENLVIVYEKFCVAEQKVHYLIYYTLFSCACLYIFINLQLTNSIPMLLTGLIVIRLCSFAIIALLVKNLHISKAICQNYDLIAQK